MCVMSRLYINDLPDKATADDSNIIVFLSKILGFTLNIDDFEKI